MLERGRLVPERRKRGFGIVDQRLEARPRGLDPEQRDKRRLAAAGILGHRLADRRFVALGIEQIVGELKGLAEGGGVG